MSGAVSSTSNADLWVASNGVTHLESAVPFSEALRHLPPGVQGVANTQAHIVSFGTWTRPDGARESAMAAAIERDASMGQPWNLVTGSSDVLARPAKALSHRLPDVDVKTTADWSSTQRNYGCPGRWPRRCLP